MRAEIKIIDAVEEAQRILADYVEPGDRDCAKTINKLLDVLDDGKLVEAVEEAKRERRQDEGRSARPQQDIDARRA